MRQLTYVRPKVVEWWDVPSPRLQDDGDAIVAPLAVTRCDLDLMIARGSAKLPGPFAIGHETTGRVVEIGERVTNVVPGDLVIVPFQISCGDCGPCRRGLTFACETVPFRASYGLKPVCGVDYGGALSHLIRVPFANHMLVKHPPGHAPSQTASLADQGTDGFAIAAEWLRQRPGASILIIGGMAQSAAMFIIEAARSLGAGRIVYIDDHAQRLAKARALGALVHEASPGLAMEPIGRFPIVIDAAATDASLLLAIRSTEPGGVCQRTYGDVVDLTPVPLRLMYGLGITLKVARANARAELPACLEHVISGHYHPEHVVTRRVRFEDAHEAIMDPTIKVAFLREGVD